jgi:hypothetical protein
LSQHIKLLFFNADLTTLFGKKFPGLETVAQGVTLPAQMSRLLEQRCYPFPLYGYPCLGLAKVCIIMKTGDILQLLEMPTTGALAKVSKS